MNKFHDEGIDTFCTITVLYTETLIPITPSRRKREEEEKKFLVDLITHQISEKPSTILKERMTFPEFNQKKLF